MALRLGFPTVRHLLAAFDITSDEFTELIALHAMGPDIGDRIDYGLAQLCAVTANSRMGAKGKAFSPTDFVPKWGERRKPLDEGQVLDLFAQLKARTDGS